MNEYNVNTKLAREEEETARDFLRRRQTELELIRHKMMLDKIGNNEEERDNYFYIIAALPEIEADLRDKTDEALERQVTWEFSPNRRKCGILVEEIPGPTRFERELEKLPCEYEECDEWGKCWASVPGCIKPKFAEYGLFPEEVKK